MKFTKLANPIFRAVIDDYHKSDNVDTPIQNPYESGSIEHDLYQKCWIDTVQWHLEDIIRDEDINPVDALALKRRIDKSNQDRTDLVEQIDSYFYTKFHSVKCQDNATINTESPAWAIDRLSILALKIYHMQEQVERTDLSTAIDQLLEDFEAGRKYMKVYKQMKMYNDPSTNPVLYGKK